jgi:Uma2 family endonuclease
MNIRILPLIDYPSSDGKPMAETPLHMRVMMDLIQTLIAWFAAKPRVYVWGNLFLYYVPGDPRKNVAPDVMVVKGVAKHRPRDVFKVWEEGRSPCTIIEVSSRKTRTEDEKTKFQLYQDVLKVNEYFLFDPRAQYLKPPLKGYRLHRGVYEPIEAEAGRLPSKELGLHLERHEQELRLWNPATELWLPTPDEVIKQEMQARQQAEQRWKQAEQGRQQAEAEVERLRAELATLRKTQN